MQGANYASEVLVGRFLCKVSSPPSADDLEFDSLCFPAAARSGKRLLTVRVNRACLPVVFYDLVDIALAGNHELPRRHIFSSRHQAKMKRVCFTLVAGISNQLVLLPILASMVAAALPAIRGCTPHVEDPLGDGCKCVRECEHTNV